jgi:hypothetical protein
MCPVVSVLLHLVVLNLIQTTWLEKIKFGTYVSIERLRLLRKGIGLSAHGVRLVGSIGSLVVLMSHLVLLDLLLRRLLSGSRGSEEGLLD